MLRSELYFKIILYVNKAVDVVSVLNTNVTK